MINEYTACIIVYIYIYIYIYNNMCIYVQSSYLRILVLTGLTHPSKKRVEFPRAGGTCPDLVKGFANSLELRRGEAWRDRC